MKRNYQIEMEKQLEGLGDLQPRLLLHSCCGPCSGYVVECLARHFELTVFFYNPNILPRQEYEKRLYWQRELLKTMPEARGIELIAPGWEPEPFLAVSRGMEDLPEGGGRCTECFALRLRETAKKALKINAEYFATTLTVSPHKDAQRINEIGQAVSGEYGVGWLYSDFKKRGGYGRSVELAGRYGLYRQNYCGCGFGRKAPGG